jgi:hypothetical protein
MFIQFYQLVGDGAVHSVTTERCKNLPPCTTELPPDDVELPDVAEINDSLFGGKGNGPPPLHIKEMHYNYTTFTVKKS